MGNMSWSKRRGKVCSASENGGGLVSCPEGGTADPDRKPAGGALYRDKREDRTNRHRPRRGVSGRYRNIGPDNTERCYGSPLCRHAERSYADRIDRVCRIGNTEPLCCELDRRRAESPTRGQLQKGERTRQVPELFSRSRDALCPAGDASHRALPSL